MAKTRFYEIIPLDTLFFRGSIPMEAGLYGSESLFPPPVSVLKGALWTAYCSNTGADFAAGLDEDGGIPAEITGFFIKQGEKLYAPAPATWYYDCNEKRSRGADCAGIPLCVAKDMAFEFSALNMKSSAGNVAFTVPKEDAKPLSGAWIAIDFLRNPKREFDESSVLFASDIYSTEPRTGVGLTEDKKAEEGKLYTSTHIRLRDDIRLVVSVESAIDFGEGKMILGGERRIAAYKKCDGLAFDTAESALYLSLMPVEATQANLSVLVASAKLAVTSGWDLAKGFHKSSVSWIPAGAVFASKVSKSCVPLGSEHNE